MKKYLIVIDAQKDFVSGVLGSEEAKAVLPNVVNRIKEAKANGERIYYTMDTHFDNYMDTLEGKKLPVPHCIVGTEGWELEDSVAELLNTLPTRCQFKKDTFGDVQLAFDFGTIANFNSDTQFEFVGYCTDICVVSNALLLRAVAPNATIICNSKCCAGTSKEAHEAALTVMRSCQIDII